MKDMTSPKANARETAKEVQAGTAECAAEDVELKVLDIEITALKNVVASSPNDAVTQVAMRRLSARIDEKKALARTGEGRAA